MSDIYGKGWGDDHDWKRGETNVTSDPRAKATYFKCAACGEPFRHAYDMEPDIFDAMKAAGVKEHCPKKEQSHEQ